MAKVTRKGLLNSLISTTLLLICIFMFCIVYIRDFFYSSVAHFVGSQFSVLDALTEQLEDGDDLQSRQNLEELVRNFAANDQMELLLLTSENKVVMTSSGFGLEFLFSRVRNLKQEASEKAMLFNLGSQKVIAFVHDLPNNASSSFDGKIMAMVLLDRINAEIKLVMGVLFTIMILILLFVVISNTYFMNSIVSVIWSISQTTNKIAKGDFRTRVVKRTNDEVGDLCDAINNMAEELGVNERMKSEFISSVSHELRTPLTSIKGWAETLEITPKDEQMAKKGLGIIISEVDRLSSMVEELLDFSRFQSKGANLNLEKLDIDLVAENIVLMFEERAKRENKSLSFNGSTKAIFVLADLNRMKQVLINVLDNALKYSNAGGKIQVFVSCVNKEDIEFALIKVIDDGCGIRADELEKVKTKFFKANYTKRGSGIGLAVADEMVKLHGGILNISSIIEEGTTVEILLPTIRKSEKDDI